MKNFRLISGTGLGLLTTVLISCSTGESPDPNQPILLGSFKAEFHPETGEISNVQAAQKNKYGMTVGENRPGGVNTLLGWGDSIDKNQALVTVSNCTTSNFNTATKVLSHNFKINAKSTNNATTQIILAPLEFRITGLAAAGGGAFPSGLITRINTDLTGQGCSNPLTLSSCDATSDGYIDIVWPWEDSTVLPDSAYQNDPGWDFSQMLGGDNQLTPGESTSCKFMQFTLNSTTESFIAYFDILGRLSSNSLAAPTVGALTTPTNNATQTVTVTLSGGADTVKISGGASTTTCVDNAVCDSNAASGTVVVSYTLNTNSTNNLQVVQVSGSNESPATYVTVVHDSVPPTIISSIPAHGATNVSPSSNILVTFDGNLSAASVTTNTVLFHRDGGNNDCSTFGAATGFSLSQPSASEVLLDPTGNLNQNQTYCVRLVGLTGGCDGTNEIQDAATNCLASTQLRRFKTTSSDNTSPYVISTIPQDGASSVSLNSSIKVVFSESMLSSTITATSFIVETASGGVAITGTRVVAADGLSATFTPSANLATSTQYKIRVTTAATDQAGNALTPPANGTEFTSFFTSGTATDTTSPSIVAFYPSNQSTNVNEYIRPQITFNEPMDPTTISSSTVHMNVKSTNASVPAYISLSADGITATVTPINALSLNTLYLVSVEFGCKDLAGNNLSSPQTAEFTTQTSADTTAPTVTNLSPADNSADVSIYTGVTVGFSEAIDPNTVHTGTFYLEDITNSPATAINGSVTVATDGLSAGFALLNPPLTKNTNHQITVKGGSSGCTTCVKDLAGNPLAADVTAIFNTEFQSNKVPTVIGVAPANSETGVSLATAVLITFSESISNTSISNGTVYLRDTVTSTNVSSLLRLMPDGVNVRITPNAALTASRAYSVNTSSGVKNLAGTSATAFSSTFTTGTGNDSTGPLLTSAWSQDSTPLSLSLSTPFTTGVKRWPSLKVTFDDTMDPSTVNIINNVELIKNSDSSKVPMRLSMSSDSKSVIINPVSLLSNLSSYTINLKQGLQNLVGLPLQSFTSFQFTTLNNSSDVTAPKVNTVVPANGSTNQSTSTVVTITLSEEVDPDTIVNGLVSVTPSGGNSPPKGDLTISLDSTRKIITITPITNYQNNTTYRVKLKNSIVDDANNGLSCSTSSVGGCDTPSNPTDWLSTFRT